MTNLLKVSDGLSDPSSEIGGLDPLIRDAGALAVYDVTNPLCNANADGLLANGAPLTNLVEGSAIQGGVAGTTLQNLAGLAGISLLGDGTVLDLGEVPFAGEFLTIARFRLPAVGYNVGPYTPFLLRYGSAYNQNTSPIWWDNGADGKTIRCFVGSGASSDFVHFSVAALMGTDIQIGHHWRADGLLELFVNGGLVNTKQTAIETLAAPVTHLSVGLAVPLVFKMSATFDLTNPRRDAAAIVADDWALRT